MTNSKFVQRKPFLSTIIDELRSYEITALIYLIATGILILFRASIIQNWSEIFIFHLFLITLILVVSRLPDARFKVIKLFRQWYLLLVFPFLFKELTILSKSLFPYYLEPPLIESELFFINLYVDFFGAFDPSELLTEIMAFSYWSYYLVISGIGLYIYIIYGDKEFDFYMFKICATFLFCYVLFILIPVRGPHHAMEDIDPSALNGWLFQSIILFMQSKGSTVGAAFPSSHVAVAWISVFALRHFEKRLYYMLIPLMVLLTVSVFYLRYHYFLDAIFGYFLAIWLERSYILISDKVRMRFVQTTSKTAPVHAPKRELENLN